MIIDNEIQNRLLDEYIENNLEASMAAVIRSPYPEDSSNYKDIVLNKVNIKHNEQFTDYIVIPYRHVKNARNEEIAFDNFISEILDYSEDYNKSIVDEYTRKGIEPKFVKVTGIEVPVLYKNRNLSEEQQVNQIIEDALELYQIIEENIIEQQKPSSKKEQTEKNIEKIVEKTKSNFYEKRRKELIGIAAGFTLLGMFAFGSNSKEKKKDLDASQTNTAQAYEIKSIVEPNNTAHFEDFAYEEPEAEKKIDISKKADEVRAKLENKKIEAKETPAPTPEAETEAKEISNEKQKTEHKIEKIIISTPILKSVPSIDINRIDISKLNLQIEKNISDRFDKVLDETFKKEGGLGATAKEVEELKAEGKDVGIIDQLTNYGVIESTLKGFKKQFPKIAKDYPESVKDLSQDQAKKIIEHAFYKQYKTNKIENESLAVMVFDISYNHSYKTFKKFIDDGIKEVEKGRKTKTDKKDLDSWNEKVAYINKCSNTELKTLYDKVAKDRLAFMKDGRVKKFKGIIGRAEGYVGAFKQDNDINKAISPEHAFKMMKSNNTINLASLEKGKRIRG